MFALSRHHRLLLAIMLLYLALAALYAARTPAWQAPDEPAHYNYVGQIVLAGCCPVIEQGDWDAAYLDALKAGEFAPELLQDLASVQYEDHQPPLYYLLLAPVYALTNGSLLALRLASALIGLGTVWCAFAAARTALPSRRPAALAAAAVVAFLPQYLAIVASVNNDSLAWALVGLVIVITLRCFNRPPSALMGTAAALGLLVGVGLLTKVSTIFLAGLVPIALMLRWRRGERRLWSLAGALAAFAVPAAALSALWWLRNFSVYGVPDLFGLAAHDRVVIGQLRTADLIAQVGWDAYLRRAVETSFNSFFGQLGWMALPLPSWAYLGALGLLALALLGWGVALARRRLSAPNDAAWWLGLAALLALAQYVYYNTEFVQFQGRYLFTALIPFAIWVASGLDRLRPARLSHAAGGAYWQPLALIPLLSIPLNLWLLWRIVPGLAPGV